MGRTIGIDFGTTNSAAAVLKDGKVKLVPASEGATPYGKMFPSVVAFREDGEIVIGKSAQAYAYVHPDRTIRWIKRRIGTDYVVEIDGRKYTSQEISALIIKKIKEDAEAYLGEKIDKAVISTPAYFNNNQRNATKEAGEKAGFEVLRVISEPTAASLAYGLDKTGPNLRIAVLDLGSGTFDVTILQISDRIFRVLSTNGDTRLGGKDMDDRILDYLVKEVEEGYYIDVRNDQRILSRLRDAGELAKIHLSSRCSTTVEIKMSKDGREINPRLVLTRCKLEELIKPELDRLQCPLKHALKDSGLDSQDIDRLILVGGPTRMPIVRRYFKDFFCSLEPEKGIDPMGIVAVGACIQASVLKGEIRDMLLLDVTPLSLGVETSGGIFTRLIKRNTTIPAEACMVFATEEDDQTSMMIHVLQGEREMAKDNMSLGLFKLDGILPAPKREQKVEVTFRIDADGILCVSAEILETGKKETIRVLKSTVMTAEDITRMIIEATKFNDLDKKRKEKIEIRCRAKNVIYEANKMIEELIGRITEKEKHTLEETLNRLEGALNSSNVQNIKDYTDMLVEQTNGIAMKAKMVSQARMLTSAMETRLDNKGSSGEKKEVRETMKRLEKVPYEDARKEMNKLKEMIALLEAEQ